MSFILKNLFKYSANFIYIYWYNIKCIHENEYRFSQCQHFS
jgi:hypothetical protein